MEKQYFAVTIKINSKGPTHGNYVNLLTNLLFEDGVFIHHVVFEEDSKGNLHLHGIFDLNPFQKISYKYLNRKYKAHIFITDLKNEKGWLSYLKKTTPNPYQQEELLNSNYFIHHHGFI